MAFADTFLAETRQIAERLDTGAIERLVAALAAVRERGGRLFILGVGGSAGNASHAVNDFRKIAGIEAYAPTDNVSELTARTNDEGWETVFAAWLKVSRLRRGRRGARCFRVGGGDAERTSARIWSARSQYAKDDRRDDPRHRRPRRRLYREGRRRRVIVPTVNAAHVTPHSEAFQAVVWHLHGLPSRAEGTRDQMGERERHQPPSVRRAVFLDRDGVLNERHRPRRQAVSAAATLDDMRVCAGAHACAESVARKRLRAASCVTNQPDIARGTASREHVERHQRRSARGLPLDDVLVCPHDDADGCACRKPQPGLLDEGARTALGSSWPAASWSATAGATSRPARRPAAAPCSSTAAMTSRGTPHREPHVTRDRSSSKPAAWIIARLQETHARNRSHALAESIARLHIKISPTVPTRQAFAKMAAEPLHQGFHDQSDPDAQGRHHRLRGVRRKVARASPATGRSRSRCSPTNRARWSGRRARSPPGAATCTSRFRSPTPTGSRRRRGPRAHGRRHRTQRHRADDGPAGR